MILVRHANERGHTQWDWLSGYHSFSFGEYYDPKQMGFKYLRVINEDTIQPGKGFGMHSHANMEIITYVVEGELAHQDSMGNGSIIKPGEIQKMSAGSGVKHSEFNYSKTKPLHLLQIWIVPNKTEITPAYEQKNIPKKQNEWILIGAPVGSDNVVSIQQSVDLYAAYLTNDVTISYTLKNKHSAWLQVVKGKINLNDHSLTAGDGAAIENIQDLKITSHSNSEILLFDFGF